MTSAVAPATAATTTTTSLADFLAGMPAVKLDRLYGSPWTCQAVFRSLPPLAKQYVLRMLFLTTPIPESTIASWAKASARSKHQNAVSRLEQLRMLLRQQPSSGQNPKPGGGTLFRLNPPFQEQLGRVIASGSASSSPRPPLTSTVRLPDMDELSKHSQAQWEAVLLTLISSEASASSSYQLTAKQHSLVRDIFRHAGLLLQQSTPAAAKQPPPTAAGQGQKSGGGPAPLNALGRFGFLLKESAEQLWFIISHYVALCEEQRGMDSSEVLAFLLELGFHSVGQPYSTAGLSQLQEQVLEDLCALGLAQIQKGMKESWFIPTPLARALSSSLSQAGSDQGGKSQGFIVVETNFRVYAYTTSRLQAEVLGLFIRVEYRLPNLVVGVMSRETIMSALDSAVTAEQIIQYLRKNAHPRVAHHVPVVPETVVDQIRLWEFDRNRVSFIPSYLYADFPSRDVFEAVVSHARDLGGLIWHDSTTARLLAKDTCHDSIKAFIRKMGSQKRKQPTS